MSVMGSPAIYPHKTLIARSFGRAATAYDALARLQGTSALELIERLPDGLDAPLVLDLGAGTGRGALALELALPGANVVALDLAEGMMRHAFNQGLKACLVGDAESLPLADGVFDVVFSNMAIQWCASPLDVFRESFRVLKPGGQMIFTSFGPQTLVELREAWRAVDEEVHVNPFFSVANLKEAIEGAGFCGCEVFTRRHRLEYPDVMMLMRELKGIGASNQMPGRAGYLTGKGRFLKMMAAYPVIEGPFGPTILATFDVVIGSFYRPKGECP